MIGQQDLFAWKGYPHSPGVKRGAPHTSRDAAESIAPKAAIIRAKVLALFEAGLALSADQCASILGIDKGTIRPRCSELAQCDPPKIVASGTYAVNESGKRAVRWRLRQ